MKIEQVKLVMKKYGNAWENKDTEMLLSCFTKNSAYQESPLAKPYRGHKEISKFWDNVICKQQTKIKFKLKKCCLSSDGKTGFAEWECWNSRKDGVRHMSGIMILRMKGDKISYLNEYWNTKIV